MSIMNAIGKMKEYEKSETVTTLARNTLRQFDSEGPYVAVRVKAYRSEWGEEGTSQEDRNWVDEYIQLIDDENGAVHFVAWGEVNEHCDQEWYETDAFVVINETGEVAIAEKDPNDKFDLLRHDYTGDYFPFVLLRRLLRRKLMRGHAANHIFAVVDSFKLVEEAASQYHADHYHDGVLTSSVNGNSVWLSADEYRKGGGFHPVSNREYKEFAISYVTEELLGRRQTTSEIKKEAGVTNGDIPHVDLRPAVDTLITPFDTYEMKHYEGRGHWLPDTKKTFIISTAGLKGERDFDEEGLGGWKRRLDSHNWTLNAFGGREDHVVFSVCNTPSNPSKEEVLYAVLWKNDGPDGSAVYLNVSREEYNAFNAAVSHMLRERIEIKKVRLEFEEPKD